MKFLTLIFSTFLFIQSHTALTQDYSIKTLYERGEVLKGLILNLENKLNQKTESQNKNETIKGNFVQYLKEYTQSTTDEELTLADSNLKESILQLEALSLEDLLEYKAVLEQLSKNTNSQSGKYAELLLLNIVSRESKVLPDKNPDESSEILTQFKDKNQLELLKEVSELRHSCLNNFTGNIAQENFDRKFSEHMDSLNADRQTELTKIESELELLQKELEGSEQSLAEKAEIKNKIIQEQNYEKIIREAFIFSDDSDNKIVNIFIGLFIKRIFSDEFLELSIQDFPMPQVLWNGALDNLDKENCPESNSTNKQYCFLTDEKNQIKIYRTLLDMKTPAEGINSKMYKFIIKGVYPDPLLKIIYSLPKKDVHHYDVPGMSELAKIIQENLDLKSQIERLESQEFQIQNACVEVEKCKTAFLYCEQELVKVETKILANKLDTDAIKMLKDLKGKYTYLKDKKLP